MKTILYIFVAIASFFSLTTALNHFRAWQFGIDVNNPCVGRYDPITCLEVNELKKSL